jgi:hypothetical protein
MQMAQFKAESGGGILFTYGEESDPILLAGCIALPVRWAGHGRDLLLNKGPRPAGDIIPESDKRPGVAMLSISPLMRLRFPSTPTQALHYSIRRGPA